MTGVRDHALGSLPDSHIYESLFLCQLSSLSSAACSDFHLLSGSANYYILFGLYCLFFIHSAGPLFSIAFKSLSIF